jgi:predicted nucleotidyltransferase
MSALELDPLRTIAIREAGLHGAVPFFLTVSGAHLYGFASTDSDFDVRGAHVLPARLLLSLSPPEETLPYSGTENGREIDFVSHEVRKFFRLLLNRNGYVLEQVFSPLVVVGGPQLDELRDIAAGCMTRGLHHHYRGFYETQRELLDREPEKKAKTVLYLYRVLLTGIHVLRSGTVESNLHRLLEAYPSPNAALDLIAAKSRELATMPNPEVQRHLVEIDRLRAELDVAWADSKLPETPNRAEDLEGFLFRLRCRSIRDAGVRT